VVHKTEINLNLFLVEFRWSLEFGGVWWNLVVFGGV
jgi:hypothetical protein